MFKRHHADKAGAARAVIASACLLFVATSAGVADTPWPEFTATSLTGKTVQNTSLRGAPALIIVTPSRDAAEATREWAAALRGEIDTSDVQIRDIIAVDLPFFISEEDAIGRARDAVPERYHDQTWILAAPLLERALDIPRDSDEACVLVLDADGNVIVKTHGPVNEARLGALKAALAGLPDEV